MTHDPDHGSPIIATLTAEAIVVLAILVAAVFHAGAIAQVIGRIW